MGIENATSTASAGIACCSLPLMGIENQFVLPPTVPAAIHLITPHGDRKHVLDWPFIYHAASLITPHGDRKPGRPPRSKVVELLCSLPLMGIENKYMTAMITTPMTALITPHGDRKLAGLFALVGYLDGHVLITPHGDRKLASYLNDHKDDLPPHYPSWGSKTPIVMESDASFWSVVDGCRRYVRQIAACGTIFAPEPRSGAGFVLKRRFGESQD